MEASFTGSGNTADMITKQSENPSGELSGVLPCLARGKKFENEGFSAVDESSQFVAREEQNNVSAMDITEGYSSDTRGFTRTNINSTICVPQILVEDWSFSEGEMEEDFEISVPFSFVGTREKITSASCKPRH